MNTKKWKELIDNMLQDFRNCDKTKLKIVEYEFWSNIPEDIIADELYVSKITVRSYLKDNYFKLEYLLLLRI